MNKTLGNNMKRLPTTKRPVPGFYFFRIVWVNPTNIADLPSESRGQLACPLFRDPFPYAGGKAKRFAPLTA
jgi:hypothetical protein